MLYCLALFSLLLSPLMAEKKVELIANFDIDFDQYTQMVQKRGFDGEVIHGDLRKFPGLDKKQTRWAKLLRKFSLDFPHKVSLPDDIAKIVFFNITVHYRRDTALYKLPKEKLVLFMWEPATVLRKMYNKTTHSNFSKIYTWDDDLVDNKTYFKLYYPVLLPMIDNLPSFEEKKLCTFISSNITPKYPNSLYGERKKAIEYFEKVSEEGFEFYGRNWDPNLYKSYRGAPKNKLETIKNYRFALCYENTHDIKGYISEKIFDCFAAGIVPIYWGASNVDHYIPFDCFIDRRKFATLEDLHSFIKALSKQEYEGYISRIRAFLGSDKAQLFSQHHFEKTFLEAIH